MIAPRAVRPGDVVTIVAPAGPVPEARFRAGLRKLEARYDVRWSERLFSRTGYLAGDDDARVDELTAALADDSTAILCARGGYGALRILDRLPPPKKCLVGFSDITALHARWQAAGLRSIHGPVVTQLGELDDEDEAALYALMEGGVGAAFEGLPTRGAATIVEGPLVGGNLELVRSLVGSAELALRGAVLLLEEVGEKPYRIDRQLTQLRRAGAFDGVAAIIVGDLVRCDESDGPRPEDVVIERLSGLGVPLLFGLPIGHGTRNRSVALGARVRVDGATGALTPLEPATA
jgi:muramoyltetrapeptide carboxypeptidase